MASALEQQDIGHVGWISAVAFSPNGKLLVSGGSDLSLILWELPSGNMLRRASLICYPSHLAFSPNGGLLLVDGMVWDVDAWEPRFQVLSGISFFRDDLLICADDSGFAALDIETGRIVKRLSLGPQFFTGNWQSAVAADGSAAVISTNSYKDKLYELAVWDLANWTLRFRRRMPAGLKALRRAGVRGSWEKDIENLALSADGGQLAVTGTSWVYLCDGASGRARVIHCDLDPIARFSVYSPNGQYLATAMEDYDGALVALFALPSGRLIRKVRSEERQIATLAYSPDSTQLVTGGGEKVLQFWNVQTGEPEGKLRAMEYEATAVTWAGSLLFAGYSDGSVRVWEPLGGQLRDRIEGDEKPVRQIAIRPAGERDVLQLSNLRRVRTSDHELLLLRPAEDDGSEVHRAISPDGKMFATIVRADEHAPRRAEVRRLDTLELVIAVPLQPSEYPDCLCLSFDGSMLATGDYDNGVYLTDLRTGKPHHAQPRFRSEDGEEVAWRYTRGPVSAIAISPDGTRLVAGAKCGELWIWDLVNIRNVHWFGDERCGVDVIIEAHGDSVRSIAFSPDGRWMATASADATVKIWRTEEWQLHSTLIVLPDENNLPSSRTLCLGA